MPFYMVWFVLSWLLASKPLYKSFSLPVLGLSWIHNMIKCVGWSERMCTLCKFFQHCQVPTWEELFSSDLTQVWSLTQIYSVDFSKSRIGVKKCLFNKRTIKVCVSCWRCPGTSMPSRAHLTVSLYLCSSGSNTRGESRSLEGRRVCSKSPSRVWDGDWE